MKVELSVLLRIPIVKGEGSLVSITFVRGYCLLNCLFIFMNSIFKFIFHWRIIALQCCVGFWHTTMCISYKYTFIPFLLDIFPPPASHSFQSSQSTELSSLYFTHSNVYVSVLLSQLFPCFPSPSVSTSPFSMSASLFLP